MSHFVCLSKTKEKKKSHLVCKDQKKYTSLRTQYFLHNYGIDIL